MLDIVKIDVEGHELQVLRGMRAVLGRSPAVRLLFEKLEGPTEDAAQINSFLHGLTLSLNGVGPMARLFPLDDILYGARIGDVAAMAAQPGLVLLRDFFAIHPKQIDRPGTKIAAGARNLPSGTGCSCPAQAVP